MSYWLFFILLFFAEIIGTVSGFGSSILFIPLASLFFDFKSVLGITAVFHIFSNLSKIILFRKHFNWKIALQLGIPAIVFCTLGALLTSIIPQQEIELTMNIMLVILALLLMWSYRVQIQQNRRNLFIGGTLSGFLAGLVGTGGAIRGITLTAFQLEKNILIATSALIDLGVDSSRAIVYISQGYFLKEHFKLLPFFIVISFAGSYVGKLVLHRMSQKTFKIILLSVVVMVSIYQVIKYLLGPL